MEFRWLEQLCNNITPQDINKSECLEPIAKGEIVVGTFTENQKKLWAICRALESEAKMITKEEFNRGLEHSLTKSEYEKQKNAFHTSQRRRFNTLDRQHLIVDKLFWSDVYDTQVATLDDNAWKKTKGFGTREGWQIVSLPLETSSRTCPNCGKEDCEALHLIDLLMGSPSGEISFVFKG